MVSFRFSRLKLRLQSNLDKYKEDVEIMVNFIKISRYRSFAVTFKTEVCLFVIVFFSFVKYQHNIIEDKLFFVFKLNLMRPRTIIIIKNLQVIASFLFACQKSESETKQYKL